MEKELIQLMNDHLLEEAALSFGVVLRDLNYIGGFQNFIYEYVKNGKTYILRITHSSHRDVDSVKAELEWVHDLHRHGVSVSKPVTSRHDNPLEVILLDNSYVIITSFEKASGTKINYPDCMNNDSLSEKCGEITGQIHALSKSYVPAIHSMKRHDWTGNYYVNHANQFIPASQRQIFANMEQLKTQIHGLPKTDSYGLIHGDINIGNFLVDGDRITLFDFDECQYSWFVEDIAIQLFYMVYVVLDDSLQERQDQARRFMKHFLKGYERQHSIHADSLKHMELFLRLREFIVYVGMYRSFDFSNLNDWTQKYIQESRNRLEAGIPIVQNLL